MMGLCFNLTCFNRDDAYLEFYFLFLFFDYDVEFDPNLFFINVNVSNFVILCYKILHLFFLINK
jgi:hypothetical protein